MDSADRADVRPNDTSHGCGGSLWDGVARGVWFSLGVMALLIAGVSAIGLLAAIDRKAWTVIKSTGGMVFLGLGSAYLAFKHACKPFPPRASHRGGSRDARINSLVPFAGGLDVSEKDIEALAATTGHPLRLLASQLMTLSPQLARKLIEQAHHSASISVGFVR